MTTTTLDPPGRWTPDQACPTDKPILLLNALKRAAFIVKEEGLVGDDDKPLRVDAANWRTILEDVGDPVPQVITGYIDGEPVIDGETKTGSRKREKVQSVARPIETGDGMVINCSGPCGQTKPVKKFPTLKGGGPGMRGTVCRDCEVAIRLERKAAHR